MSACKVEYSVVKVFSPADGSGGNRAAVVQTQERLEVEAMARIAREIGLAACAFLSEVELDAGQTAGRANLAWFSKDGVRLAGCGHGTIAASSHLISNHPTLQSISYSANVPTGPIELEVRATRVSGTLAFEVGFPALDDVRWLDASAGSPLLAGLLGAVERLNAEAVLGVARLGRYSVVGLRAREDRDVLGRVTVNSVALGRLQEFEGTHIVLTALPSSGSRTPWSSGSTDALSTSDHDVQSRVFCPSVGILEDECTGSSIPALMAFYDRLPSRCSLSTTAEFDLPSLMDGSEVRVWQRGPLGGGRVRARRVGKGVVGVVGEGTIVHHAFV